MGHLGGLLSGIILGLSLIPSLSHLEHPDNKSAKRIKIIGIIAALVFFIGGFTMFYTLRNPRIWLKNIKEINLLNNY